MLFKSFKRSSLKKTPLSDRCMEYLFENVPFWGCMDDSLRSEVTGIMQVLLHEKYYEGCGGLTLTDEMKWTITAHASLMIAGDISDFYPHLDSVLVYPRRYVADVHEEDEIGFVRAGEEVRSGESWEGGALVLSWKEIKRAGVRNGIYTNLIFHEFAHQIDQELGVTPRLESMLSTGDDGGFPWIERFSEHYDRFMYAVESGRPAFFDPYGAEHPAEFFAVVTETFFGIPHHFKKIKPGLFELMTELYQLDPASRINPNYSRIKGI